MLKWEALRSLDQNHLGRCVTGHKGLMPGDTKRIILYAMCRCAEVKTAAVARVVRCTVANTSVSAALASATTSGSEGVSEKRCHGLQ